MASVGIDSVAASPGLASAAPRVLCVDDDPAILAGLSRTLCSNFDVVTSDDPGIALSMLGRSPSFAVVICDMKMPQMDGAEFFARAKAFAPAISVNAVAPGVIPFDDIDEEGKRLIAITPAQRGGTPDEIADAVLFFLKTTTFITGQNLAVDGGLSQK